MYWLFYKRSQIACTIVAILLHYFFTAVFTWMMCEGIMIYLLLVKVFSSLITNKRWIFLLLGWGKDTCNFVSSHYCSSFICLLMVVMQQLC